MTAKAGYTLTGVTANFFTVAGATSVTNAADSGVVAAVFPATAPLTIEGYYTSDDNSDTPLVTTANVANGTTESAALSELSAKGVVKLSDGRYEAITITWSFDGTYDGTVAGAKTVTGTVSPDKVSGLATTTQTGTVTVAAAIALSSDTSVSSVIVKDVSAVVGDTNDSIYNVALPESTDLSELQASDFVVTATDPKAKVGTVTGGGDIATWKVRVTAEDGDIKDYTIKITVKLAKIELTVIEPVDGEAPDFNVNPLGVGYSASSVKWFKGSTDTEAATFEAGQQYRLRMNISINIGYSFDKDTSVVLFNDQEVTVGNVNGSTLENVYYIFTAK